MVYFPKVMRLLFLLITFLTSQQTLAGSCRDIFKSVLGPNQIRYFERQTIFQPGHSFYTASDALWNIRGGTGKGVKVIDVEKSYNPEHKLFAEQSPLFVSHLPRFELDSENRRERGHGTAVQSIIRASHDNPFMKGLAPDVSFGFMSYYAKLNQPPKVESYKDIYETLTKEINPLFEEALKTLGSGDVLLVEIQVPMADPLLGIVPGTLVPPTYYSSTREILNRISQNGVFVVLSAGNMGANLDHAFFGGRFQRSLHSNLIYAGSASTENAQLFKNDSSNYGQLVEVYGPGQNVVAAGNLRMDLSAEKNAEFFSDFSGTSSAGAVIAGVIAQVSGVAKNQHVTITPKQMREALRSSRQSIYSATINHPNVGNYVNVVSTAQALKLNIE